VSVERPAPGEELNAGEAAPAREASSLILLRDAAQGPEVLLVKRNPEQRFMGGAWVFPGGAVHAEDGDVRTTARRELAEEAGIALSADAELARFSRWITPRRSRSASTRTSSSPSRRPPRRRAWTAPSASRRAGCGRPTR